MTRHDDDDGLSDSYHQLNLFRLTCHSSVNEVNVNILQA